MNERFTVVKFLDILACIDEHIGYDFLTVIEVGCINAFHNKVALLASLILNFSVFAIPPHSSIPD